MPRHLPVAGDRVQSRLWLRGKNGVAIIGAVNSTNKILIAETAASCDALQKH